MNVRRGASRNTDVWVYDVLRGAPTRLTFNASNSSPIWSPDGKRLVYSSKNLYAINADGTGQPARLTTGEYLQTASSWASTGNVIAFLQRPGPNAGSGIWVLPWISTAPRRGCSSNLDSTSRIRSSHPMGTEWRI